MPVYWHSHYEKLGYEKGLCPNAESYYMESMSLPLYYAMTDADVQDVIIKEIDARLSACDNIEKTVDTALQQAEAMRQSILKQAFEGRL